MGWDIILFNSSQRIEAVENIEEEKLVETNFDPILLVNLKPAKIVDGNVNIENEAYALNFFIDEESVSNKVLTLYNENALFEIIKIAKAENWQIFDTGSGEMINFETPEINGYENFQKYLQLILGKQ